MKRIERYCGGQVGLYEHKLSDGSKVYYVRVQCSGDIPVRSLADGIELGKAFERHAA